VHGGWLAAGWRLAGGWPRLWLLQAESQQKLAKVQELKSLFLRSADFANPLH
jgi:hypothetical protein